MANGVRLAAGYFSRLKRKNANFRADWPMQTDMSPAPQSRFPVFPAGRGLRRLVGAALLGLMELVLGPIWVWAVYGEKPGDLTLAGGAIVIGAAAVNVWLDSRAAAR